MLNTEKVIVTDDDGLGFALHSHPSAGAGGHLHPIQDPRLKTPHHNRTDGSVHSFIDMETGFVPQTPDLKENIVK